MDGYQVASPPVPQDTTNKDLQNLSDYTFSEYNKLQAILQQAEQGLFTVRSKTIPKPRRGNVVYADGTNWNPTLQGEGPIFYDGADWRKLIASPSTTAFDLRYNWSNASKKVIADVSYRLTLGNGGITLLYVPSGAIGTSITAPSGIFSFTPTTGLFWNGLVQWATASAEWRIQLDGGRYSLWNSSATSKWEIINGFATANDGLLCFYDRINSRLNLAISQAGVVAVGTSTIPGTWSVGFAVLQLGNDASLMAERSPTSGSNSISITNNAYWDGATWRYIETATLTSNYYQYQGTHNWRTAVAGTPGAALAWTNVAMMDASGNFFLGAVRGGFADGSTIGPGGLIVNSGANVARATLSSTNGSVSGALFFNHDSGGAGTDFWWNIQHAISNNSLQITRFQQTLGAYATAMQFDSDGIVRIGNFTAGAPAATGYLTVRDIAGNTRKILVG